MSDTKETAVISTPRSVPSDVPKPLGNVPISSEFNTRSVLAILGSACSIFFSIGLLNAYGVFQEYYQKHQLKHKSESDIAWIGSVSSFMMFVGGAPAGLLTDRIGPRPLVAGGSIGLLLALFMTSLCYQYYQLFLAQGLLMGTSMSFLAIPPITTLPLHFNKNRGLALGIGISGSSLGGVIWPIVVDQCLNHHDVGFGWTMRIIAFIVLPLGLFSTFTVRGPARDEQKPDQEALDPSPTEAAPTPKKKFDSSLLKSPTFLVFVVGVLFFNLGMLSPFFFTTSYSVSLGHGVSFSFYILSIMNGASLFGRISGGILADSFGAFNLTCVMGFSGALVCYCWTAATTKGGLVAWAMAYGFSSGAVLSLQMQCAAVLSTKETYGMALGFAMALTAIAALVGAPISGELIPHGFFALSMYAASTLLVGAVILTISRLMQSRRLRVKV